MKQILFIVAAIGMMAMVGCQSETRGEKGVEELNSSEWDDAVKMPYKDDGTIDSTKLAIIEWETKKYDFGTVEEGEIVKYNFKFKNTGGIPLLILDAKTSCGCTVPKKPENPIGPGEEGEIEVKFNSDGWAGKPSKTITIKANTFPKDNEIKLTGTVTPKNKE